MQAFIFLKLQNLEDDVFSYAAKEADDHSFRQP
jgi:hypothetical protein